MRKNQLIFYILFFSGILSAQSDLKIGQWKAHLPYHQSRSITQSETTVYYASTYSIFMIEKDENSVQFMSKVEGLSDREPEVLKYAPAHETLIVSYKNSNIDLIKPTRIVNLPFIQQDPNIIGDKQVYNIFLADDDLAYLACGFGVVELNVDREEFGFTTKMNQKVNDVIIHNGMFYAATEIGIYQISYDGSTNLQDFGNWKLLGIEEGFPEDYSSNSLEVYDGKLYCSINDTLLYSYNNSTLTEIYQEEGFEITFLSAEGAHLLVGLGCIGDCTGKVLFFDENLNTQRSGDRCVSRTRYAIEDEAGGVWYSDKWDAIRISNSPEGDCVRQTYNSPYTHHATELVTYGDELFVASVASPIHSTNGFYHLNNGDWTNYNALFHDDLFGMESAYRIAVHPENEKVYIGSLSDGLWEKEEDSFQLFDESNSLLRVGSDPGRIRVSGLAFDENNDLWMSNNTSANPIIVLRNDGTWQNNFTSIVKELRQVVIDNAGNKWFQVDGSGQGIVVFNENDITDPTDDMIRSITSSNSSLPTNEVNCLAVDLDGDVWVGTDEGVIVFECGANVFDSQCRGSRRIVEVDGFNAYLLETENVTTIAVDGANRKWIGTNNGVFVQSANGEEQIAFFDEDNSPLFDNNINDIAINDRSGEIFIGTASGLISIRGEATGGGSRHESTVYAYPNPVRSDYNGPIAIKGLPRDADVKITDIKGQLIYETKALGGQAIWDGRDYNGRKAASGVYLVFSTSKEVLDNPDANVTKILFMK